MAKPNEYKSMDTGQLREKLRRTCYEKLLAYFEDDVEGTEAQVAVQTLGTLGKEDATTVHERALTFAIEQATGKMPKQIEGKQVKKDAA